MVNKTKRNIQRVNNRRDNNAYVQGNVVRKLNVVEEIGQAPSRRLSHTTRKNRDRALYMNLGYVLFLVAALAFSGMILISHIRLQSEITLAVKNIASMESELNNLRLSNEEDYNRALSSVDLDEIRSVAIGELGMRYAKEGQIINVASQGSDYVRQLAQIKK